MVWLAKFLQKLGAKTSCLIIVSSIQSPFVLLLSLLFFTSILPSLLFSPSFSPRFLCSHLPIFSLLCYPLLYSSLSFSTLLTSTLLYSTLLTSSLQSYIISVFIPLSFSPHLISPHFSFKLFSVQSTSGLRGTSALWKSSFRSYPCIFRQLSWTQVAFSWWIYRYIWEFYSTLI